MRRLALHRGSSQGENITKLQAADMVHVRSIHAFSCPSIMSMMPPLSIFQVLRVLSLEYCIRSCNLKHLGKLVQLRYLNLSGMFVDELPREIRNLVHLQSLDVRGTGLKELPVTVSELSNLMRLLLTHNIELLPSVGKLTSLQDLRSYVPVSITVELGMLTELRVLHITLNKLDEGKVKVLEESLHCLNKIRDLFILCQGGSTVMSGLEDWEPSRQLRKLSLLFMPLPRLPSWLNSERVPHLFHLILHVKAMEAQDMDILALMPELRYLDLSLDMGRSLSWTFAGGSLFSNLRYMGLNNIVVNNVHLLKNVKVDIRNDYGDDENTSSRDQELPQKRRSWNQRMVPPN